MPTPTPATSNPLYDLIPAKSRRTTYAIFALVGLIMGAVQVGFFAVDPDLPTWLNVTIIVYNFLALPFGALAASNVPSPERIIYADDMQDVPQEGDVVLLVDDDEPQDESIDTDYDPSSLPSDEAPEWTDEEATH